MSQKRLDKTVLFPIPKENAKLVHERIEVFLEMYLKDQVFLSKFRTHSVRPDMDLKGLCYSCYSQGLIDGNELFNTQKNGK